MSYKIALFLVMVDMILFIFIIYYHHLLVSIEDKINNSEVNNNLQIKLLSEEVRLFRTKRCANNSIKIKETHITHIDTDYFINKLKLVIRDIKMYTPNELARELERLSQTAKEDVTK